MTESFPLLLVLFIWWFGRKPPLLRSASSEQYCVIGLIVSISDGTAFHAGFSVVLFKHLQEFVHNVDSQHTVEH